MKRLLVFLVLLSMMHSADAATVETFVSPDSSFPALSRFISDANETLFLASYTFSSPEIAQMLMDRASAGVDVGLIVEKSPAGGMSDYEVSALCSLSDNSVDVMLYDGPLRYMHAKYVIRDSEDVLVTSENFGYSGFMPGGDYGNRGWGIIVYDGLAGELLSVHANDSIDSVPFACPLDDYGLESWDPAGAHEPYLESRIFNDQRVELIYSPDSLDGLLDMINSAEKSVLVQQFYIYTHWGSPSKDSVGSSPSPVLEALIEKARKGVPVRIILDSTYYEMDPESSVSNYNTIEYVRSIASDEGIPIEIKANDRESLAMIHNKGLVIDSRKALISSINWNENSIMNNRETGIIVEGDAAGYYEEAFWNDWGESPEDHGLGFWPAMLSLAALVIVILYFWRRNTSRVFSWL